MAVFPKRESNHSFKRNTDQYESLFHTYYSGLVVYANKLTGDSTIAEDIVCDLFATIWEQQEILQKENCKAYLFTAVRNRSLNYLSQLRVRSDYQEAILEQGEVGGMLTWDYYVETELREQIEQAIAKLPEKCQKIFVMNRLEHKRIHDIAETLQLSPRTVEKQLEIALKKLRIELADYLSVAIIALLLQH